MGTISALGYMVVCASNLEEWASFASDIVGAQPRRNGENGALAIRLDEFAYRILVIEGEDEDLFAAGWDLETEEALKSFIGTLRNRGMEITLGDDALRDVRQVEKLYWCVDPDGLRHEFYFGLRCGSMADPFMSKGLVGPGFLTGPLGAGHFVHNARSYEATLRFYRDVLGLRLSDFIRQTDTPVPGNTVEVAFLHTRTGRHHSVAIAVLPDSKRTHHLMVELQSLDDVGLAYDRCLAQGVPIQMGIGHHPNDRMTSFYMETPSGFALEYGWGAIVVDDENWSVKSYSILSDWGHRPPVHG